MIRTSPNTAYCAADPVNLIDPTGMSVTFLKKGQRAEHLRAVIDLQKAVGNQLLLYLNENQSLKYSLIGGTEATDLKGNAKKLAEIIDAENIDVGLNFSSDGSASNGSYLAGGSFMGNTLNADGSVNTLQDINMPFLREVAKITNKPGIDLLHELTESYQGALLAQSLNKSLGSAQNESIWYTIAHKNASPQSCIIRSLYRDSHNQPTENTSEIFYVEYYAISVCKKNLIKRISRYDKKTWK